MHSIIPTILVILCFQLTAFSQQNYYKIYFSAEGIYKITGQQLADAGVPISRINPPTIQVFSDSQKVLPYSTTAPLPSLHEIAIVVEDGGDQSFDPQDYILFYGQTLNRFEWDASQSAYTNISSPYDTLSCYWLRWNVQNGKRMRVKDGTPVTGNSTLREMFTDRLHLEKDRRNPFKSGLEWSWNLFNENQILFERNFELSGVAGTNASLTAHLLHFDIYYINIPPGEMTLTVNNALVGTTTSGEISATVPISEGSNSFRLEYTVPAPGDTVERSGLDWVALNYPRYTHLIDSEIKIFTEQASGIFHTRYRSGSVSDSILMFDITDPFNVAQIETANDSLFEDTLSAEHKMYYLTRNGFTHAVESIEPAQREIFSTGDGADYIIITRQATESEMLPLKTHREPHNNFVVKIVTVENIFDEFGFGREDPTAIRNFIRFAYTNWQPQPQFILFAGSGYYDYRNLTGNYPVNWVPTFEITDFNNINSRNTDDYFVDLDFTHSRNAPQINPGDDFLTGLWQNRFNSEFLQEEPPRSSDFRTIQPDLPIGRLPADTPAELSTLVTKIIDSEINYQPGLWRLNTLLIADDQNSPSSGNDFFFTELLERFWKRRLPRSFRTFKLYEIEYQMVNGQKPAATQQLINWLNLGSRFVAFSGHADEKQLTYESLLKYPRDMSSINNEHKTSFFWGVSQLYKFDDIHQGILQELLKRESSGFYGTLTPNRPVFLFQSNSLLNLFSDALFNGADGFIGRAVLHAKEYGGGGFDSQKYSLLGDPASKLTLPQERVFINSINPDTLKARSLVQMTGQVNNSMSGDSLLIEVREPGQIKTFSNSQGGVTFESTGNALYRGYVSINNGTFTTEFVVSDDIPHDSTIERGQVYAYTWNGLNEGMGFRDSLIVGGLDTSITDVTVPQISLSISSGDTLGTGDYLVAELSDENGINLSSWGNHYPMLFIDNNFQDTHNLADFFTYQPASHQVGTLRYPLPFISAGSHTLTLQVHDNFNNFASDSVDFITGVKPPPQVTPDQITLAQNYPNPFNPETHIQFTLSGSNHYQVRLEIYNILGQRVRVLLNGSLSAGEYEIRWDGRDRRGNPVASGIYIYRLWVSSHAPQGMSNQRGGIYQRSRKMVLLK